MKTRDDVERLKANWFNDPCYDLEDVAEEPEWAEWKDELLGYAEIQREVWAGADEKSKAIHDTLTRARALKEAFAHPISLGGNGALTIPDGSVVEFVVQEKFEAPPELKLVIQSLVSGFTRVLTDPAAIRCVLEHFQAFGAELVWTVSKPNGDKGS